MKPQQLSVEIENDRIMQIKPVEGFSEIIKDGISEKFDNAYILPGMVESHCHIWGLGMILHDPNFVGMKSIEECIDEIKKHKPNKGEWYFGRGWNHELWENPEYPNKSDLDSILPDNPAYFIRIDGHSVWVNSKALEIAGIDKNTPNPKGGEIVRDKDGEATGILVDNAMELIAKHIPDYSDERLEMMIKDALRECAKVGIVELHDMDVPVDYVDKFIELDKKGELKQRVKSYVAAQNDQYIKKGLKPYKGDKYHLAGIKFFVDGALGSRGALLLEPYSDAKDTKGLQLISNDDLYNKICKGIEAGFEIAVHAIGDAANKIIIDTYEKIREKYGYEPYLRIEHAQTLTVEDKQRVADLEIIAAVQSIHCTSDAEMALKRLGEDRCRERAYPWKSLLEKGVKIMGGSDFPIEPFNPFLGIDSYVNRKSIKTNEEFFPDEKISLEEAIKSYTINVYDNFDRKNYGKIEVGFNADIAVIDNDLMNDIKNTKILSVYSDGEKLV